MALTGALLADSAGDKFAGPVDSSGEVGKAQRARNISGNLAASEVALYDAAGNPLLTAAFPGYIVATDGDIATLGSTDDIPWTGTGEGTAIAILKALWSRFAAIVVGRTGIFTPATATTVAGTSGDRVGKTAVANCILVGFSMWEAAGTPAAARVILHHGTDATGQELALVGLTAEESTREWWAPEGIPCASGIYVEQVSGETKIVLYTKVVA